MSSTTPRPDRPQVVAGLAWAAQQDPDALRERVLENATARLRLRLREMTALRERVRRGQGRMTR